MPDAMKFWGAFHTSAKKLSGIHDSTEADLTGNDFEIDVEKIMAREMTDKEVEFYNEMHENLFKTPAKEPAQAKYPVYPPYDERWLLKEVNFTEWDPTDPSEVPFGLSTVHFEMKIQPHVAMAAHMAQVFASKVPRDMKKAAANTLDKCKKRVAQLQEEFPDAKDVEDFLTRPFTSEEKQFFEANNGTLPGLDVHQPHPASDPPSTAQPSASKAQPSASKAQLARQKLPPPTSQPQQQRASASPEPPPRRSTRAAMSPKKPTPEERGAGATCGRGRGGAHGGKQDNQQFKKRRRGAPYPREDVEEPLIKTVVKKRRHSHSEVGEEGAAEVVVTAHAIPISENSGRILMSKVELGKIYGKSFLSDNPVKPLPLQLEGSSLSCFNWYVSSIKKQNMKIYENRF